MENTKMSYTPGTTPRNFEEFLECYENELIVRRLFPKKHIGIGKGDIYKRIISSDGKTEKCRKYWAFCNSNGYQISELDKPNKTYDIEKRCVYQQICASEDFILFNGDEKKDIDGINTIATNFDGTLQEAIEKYSPVRIAADRHTLQNIDITLPKEECPFIKSGICYLFPEITPDIAEFVIWKDVYENPVPVDGGCGTSICYIYEWVSIAIHKPEEFIKVDITRC